MFGDARTFLELSKTLPFYPSKPSCPCNSLVRGLQERGLQELALHRLTMHNADEDTDGVTEVSFLRFVTTRTRSPDDPLLQLAQFLAYGAEGEQLQLVDARNPRGDSPGDEGPTNALDGSAHTKWLDANKGVLECRIASGPTKVTGYALMTADDDPGRDPVRWVVEGRLGEGGEWHLLDDKDTGEDQQVPENSSAASLQINSA